MTANKLLKVTANKVLTANKGLKETIKVCHFHTHTWWSVLWQKTVNKALKRLQIKLWKWLQAKLWKWSKQSFESDCKQTFESDCKQSFEKTAQKKQLWKRLQKKKSFEKDCKQSFEKTANKALKVTANKALRVTASKALKDPIYRPATQCSAEVTLNSSMNCWYVRNMYRN